MLDIATSRQVDQLLTALSEQLERTGSQFELVMVGGSALLALGLIDRPTKDVDVVALREADVLEKADPLPVDLRDAIDRVARDFGLPQQWINPGPASLMDFGLPEGFLDRVETRRWTTTHDVSPGFQGMLERALRYMGVEDADLGA
jgi:hypothetical protein